MNHKNYSNQLSVDAHRKVEERDFWLKKLAGHPDKCGFPHDRKKSAKRPRRMTAFSFNFSHQLTRRILEISNNSELRLYIILVTGIVELLKRYTGKEDIILGAPVYKQEVDADFINTLLILRLELNPSMTVKDLLVQVSQTISEAARNANYPVETLLYQLDISYSGEDDFPLFDVVASLDNIQDKEYISSIYTNVRFSFSASSDNIEGCLEYNAAVYDEDTVKQWIRHLSQWLERGFSDPSAPLADIDIISSRERRQLLEEFNANSGDYPSQENIISLFTAQKEHTPQQIAVHSEEYGPEEQLTYEQLAQKASGLARLLREKGVGKDDVIGLMTDRTTHMMVGIMGILQAGAAYLPINPEYPEKRISFLLKDSRARLLLTQTRYMSGNHFDHENDSENDGGIEGEIIDLESEDTYIDAAPGNGGGPSAGHLAYIIYTSGSTGTPKGVMIEHRHVINLVYGLKQKVYDLYPPHLRVALVAPFIFDASVQQIFGALLLGHGLYIVPENTRVDGGQLLIFLHHHRIDVSDGTPAHLQLMLNSSPQLLATLPTRHFIIGGEALPHKVARRFIKGIKEHSPIITNVYGPAECCVDVSAFDVTGTSVDAYENIPIGKPMLNRKLYLLDKTLGLTPIGVPGEIHISGHGIGRGYLGQQRLTGQRFMPDPFESGLNLYKTGDLARWLKDGNIEFLGRIDLQVKIRGYRIELGEIEQQLLLHPGVKESVVIVYESEDSGDNGDGNKSLCAYVVTPETIEPSELREFLANILPDYMIPSYFVSLEAFPLTPNGKIDRKALPAPDLFSGAQYVAPRNDVEEKLADIWSDVLNIDKDQLGIDNGFFEVGGHSLKATILIANIHKTFNVKIPIAEIFSVSTIRGLGEYIRNARQDRYAAIEPVEEREYYTLSSAQKRVFILHSLEEDSLSYNAPLALELRQRVEHDKLEQVFLGLIKRHESLRTSFHMLKDQPVQRVHPIDEIDFRMERIQVKRDSLRHTLRDFTRPFDLAAAPLIRAGLVDIDTSDKSGTSGTTGASVRMLLVDMHHIISDGASQALLEKEFMALFNGQSPDPLRLQYKDYAAWQNHPEQKDMVTQQQEFWLKTLSGELPVIKLPTDHPRPPVQSFEGDSVSFVLSANKTRALQDIADQSQATLYMLLLAVSNVLAAKLSGQEDIIIGTPVAGRRHSDLERIIGMFVNTLAMRNFPNGDKSFREFLKEVRRYTLEAFENQEYQFEDLVESLDLNRDTSRNPVFDMMFSLQHMNPGMEQPQQSRDGIARDLEDVHISKFDLSIDVGVGEETAVVFEYCTKLFDRETIERFAAFYREIITCIIDDADQKISMIDIMNSGDKRQILLDFNTDSIQYAENPLLHRLFEDRAEHMPHRTAAVFHHHHISYGDLNRRAHQLAGYLNSRGVGPDTIVGLIARPSLETIIGILGILKAGGAYLPLNPAFPQNRLQYMIDDAGPALLLSAGQIPQDLIPNREVIPVESFTAPDAAGTYDVQDVNDVHDVSNTPGPGNLAYVIYTSGSSGRPKGVLVEHGNAASYVDSFLKEFNPDAGDAVLQQGSYSFDAFVEEMYPVLSVGGKLVIADRETVLDVDLLAALIEKMHITLVTVSPGLLKELSARPHGSTIHTYISGGDVLRPGDAHKLPSPSAVYNTYGPTETTVCATYYKLPSAAGDHAAGDYANDNADVPIGKPIRNYKVVILDKYMQLLPVGVPGELCICGAGTSRGYLNQPELTAQAFVPNPMAHHNEIPGNILYRTGDRACWLPDGNIRFMGRIDDQVQIRGFRIEPGEIEYQLSRSPQIKEAVVQVHRQSENDPLLCAYVVPELDGIDNTTLAEDLRTFLGDVLPDYMIPAYIMPLDAIPMTVHGKIDRAALPLPTAKPGATFMAPRTAVETALAEIWADVLDNDGPVGIDDNFFRMGGHSLKATVMASRLHKQFKVKVPLAELFMSPTIRGLARYIQDAAPEHYSAIQPVEPREYYPLSSAQKRLFFLDRISPDEIHYNMPQVLPVEAPDIDAYKKAFQTLIARHQSLRTSFLMAGRDSSEHGDSAESVEPVQQIHDTLDFQLEVIDAGNRSSIEILRQFVRPFDLASAPLIRAALLNTKNKKQLLMVDMHHIISDGISHQVLSREFLTLYQGKGLDPLRIQYKDFAVWQNSAAEKEKLRQQEQYWLDQFKEPAPVLDLPLDFPRPAFQSFEGASEEFSLSAVQTRGLKDLALQSNGTLFMVVTAVFNAWLSRLSNQEDIVIGTAIAGRRHADLEHIIGMFVNTLALRNYPQSHLSFNDFLQSVKERSLEAFENQEYHFEDLVDKVVVNRDASRNPLFDVMFNMQAAEDRDNIENREISRDKDLEELERFMDGVAKFDITFSVIEADDRLHFALQYCTKLFKAETIQQMNRYFKRLTDSFLAHPDRALHRADIMSEEEKQRMLQNLGGNEDEYPMDRSLHTVIEDQARNNPHRIALVEPARQAKEKGSGQSLTYAQLNESANHLAARLRRQGLKSGDIAAILLPQTPITVIAILAVLKTGAAYLPLETQYPDQRIRYILEDSHASILITHTPRPEPLPDHTAVVDPSAADSQDEDFDFPTVAGDAPAYIIYTSGTTGKPKGAMVDHRAVHNLSVWKFRCFQVTREDRTLKYAGFAFDASVIEIFPYLITGASIYFPGEEIKKNMNLLHRFIEDNAVTILFLPTQVGEQFMAMPNSALRLLYTGGDKLRRHVPQNYTVVNIYGPTEFTVVSSSFTLDPEAHYHNIPIGIPVNNTRFYILDKHMQLQPPEVAGELYIAGAGMSMGYLNRPALTAERFVDNPFEPGRKMYRCGDLARRASDGNVLFLGRVDRQVQLRGLRIEIGEIESLLQEHDIVNQVVVVCKEDSQGDKTLCAYVVSPVSPVPPASGPGEPGDPAAILRRHLEQQLPEYMIPSFFVILDRFPLTPNGKIDFSLLPEPSRTGGEGFIAPRDEIERSLAQIWSEILDLEQEGAPSPGIDDNFFQLGGHSLKAMTTVARIHKTMEIEVPLAELFKTPSIRGLAQYIRNSGKETYSAITPVETSEHYPLSSAQKRLYILDRIAPHQVLYNIPQVIPVQDPDIDAYNRVFNRLIQRHESFRTSFHMVAEQPVQKVHDSVSFQVEAMDAGDRSTIDVLGEFVRPFDLFRAPLLRAAVLHTRNQRHLLLIDMHHIISDGVSHQILSREFQALYEGNEIEPISVQYKDFAVWQNSAAQKEKLRKQEQYWLDQFEEPAPVLNLPVDFPRPAFQSFDGAFEEFTLDSHSIQAIKDLALQSNGTPFMVLVAAFNALLARLSNQEDIVIGTPIAGRRHADLEDIIGMFVNTLALRNYPLSHLSFHQFLQSVKDRSLEAFENQEYQFEDLVEKVVVDRDASRNPLFDVMFNMQTVEPRDDGETKESQPDDDLEELDRFMNSVAKFDLTLTIIDAGDQLHFSLQYCSKLYRAETIQGMIRYFKRLLDSFLAHPHRALHRADIMSEEEKRELLQKLGGEETDYPKDRTIHTLIEDRSDAHANRVALVGAGTGDSTGESLTYAQLSQRADGLAARLSRHGLKQGHIAALMLSQTPQMVIAILAVLKTGAAYLPVDPNYPRQRIRYILKDSRSRLVLTETPFLELLPEHTTAIDLSRPEPETEAGQTATLPATAGGDAAVYVIYTSGSTGRPKGTVVEHRSLQNSCAWQIDYYGINHEDRTLKYAGFSFDASVFEIFPYLSSGASIYFPGDRVKGDIRLLNRYMEENAISITFLPTQVAEQFMELANSSLRILYTGGDTLRRYTPRSYTVVNNYGPTEYTIVSSVFTLDPEAQYTTIPIGAPIHNTRLYILDKHLGLQPDGVAGELYISGAGMSRGYLNRPELTAQRFMDNPFEPGQKMYRSGDMAIRGKDGNILFLGRADRQVKLRGLRIEIGEIESLLLAHETVNQALVVCKQDPQGDNMLCAYIVVATPGSPRPEDAAALAHTLKTRLEQRLPAYMIPSFFTAIDRVPLTPNGKIDFRALPEPSRSGGDNFIAPRDDVERTLARIWWEVLEPGRDGAPGPGIDDNFFQMGGHSLKAMTAAARIHKELDIELPLAELFMTPTVRGLAQYIRNAAKDTYSAIPAVETSQHYTLSSAQKRLFILDRISPEQVIYNMPQAIPVQDPDIEAYNNVFNRLIQRHESFRTSFHLNENQSGEPVQKIHDSVAFEVDVIAAGSRTTLDVLRQFTRPFDLSRAPLLRAAVLTAKHQRKLLLVDMHHIISDGVSHRILMREFQTLYEGKELEPISVQYKDFAAWQNSADEKAKLHRKEQFWLDQFQEPAPVLNLPLDFPRPTYQSSEGACEEFTLDKPSTQALKELALQSNATLFMVLVAAFNVLLARLSNQEDIVIGTPIAGRRHADLENVIGMFVNTLALRNFPQPQLTFHQFLQSVKERSLAAFENQEYQFEDLVEQVVVDRDASRNPLFDVMFSLQNVFDGHAANTEDQPESTADRDMDELNEFLDSIAKFDLSLDAVEDRGQLYFSFQYCSALFKPQSIQRITGYFEGLLRSLASNPYQALWELDIISPPEKRQLLIDFNRTGASRFPDSEKDPGEKDLTQLFSDGVRKHPDRVAAVVDNHYVTYGELEARAQRLAAILSQRGIGGGEGNSGIVALLTRRSADMITGILGTLLAGAAYLPLSPENPAQRNRFMLEDSRAAILFTTLEGDIQSLVEGTAVSEVLTPEILSMKQPMEQPMDWPLPDAQPPGPNDLAYVIYTSGSTGQPKAVMMEHHAVINLVRGLNERIYNRYNRYNRFDGSTKALKVAMVAPYVFDASVQQIFGVLLGGHTLDIVKEEDRVDGVALLNHFQLHRTDICDGTPSHLRLLQETLDYEGSNLPGSSSPEAKPHRFGVRHFIIGGEALPRALVERFYATLERVSESPVHTEITNVYGPTECCVDSTSYPITAANVEDYPVIPIGKPMPGEQVYILDRQLGLKPIGAAGELCIGGRGVARGYLERPELSGEKFVANPYFQDVSAALDLPPNMDRIYRTGDLARWLPDGNIQFLGRMDNQVQLRGFRIETGEIENVLLSHDDIKEALVMLRTLDDDRFICAYLVSDNMPASDSLREFMSRSLPAYMVPSSFIRIEQLPLTPNGKIDYRALPEATGPGYTGDGTAHEPPANEVETELVAIWAQLLGLESEGISTRHDFFAIGGHSLKATILAVTIRDTFGVHIPAAELFNRSTIRSQAQYITQDTAQYKTRSKEKDGIEIHPSAVILKKGDNPDLHLFLIHDGTGGVDGYIDFVAHVDKRFNCWGLVADPATHLAPQNLDIRQVAETYVSRIKTINRDGSFFIGGWSLGGSIAFEMARQLEQAGETPAFTALIDSPAPAGSYDGPEEYFTPSSETLWLKHLLPETDFRQINPGGDALSGTHELWERVAAYLENKKAENTLTDKSLLAFFPAGFEQMVPHYKDITVKELLGRINAIRSWGAARARYIPGGILQSPLITVAARASGQDIQNWRQFTDGAITHETIPGDHYSILKEPHVRPLKKIIADRMAEILENPKKKR